MGGIVDCRALHGLLCLFRIVDDSRSARTTVARSPFAGIAETHIPRLSSARRTETAEPRSLNVDPQMLTIVSAAPPSGEAKPALKLRRRKKLADKAYSKTTYCAAGAGFPNVNTG